MRSIVQSIKVGNSKIIRWIQIGRSSVTRFGLLFEYDQENIIQENNFISIRIKLLLDLESIPRGCITYLQPIVSLYVSTYLANYKQLAVCMAVHSLPKAIVSLYVDAYASKKLFQFVCQSVAIFKLLSVCMQHQDTNKLMLVSNVSTQLPTYKLLSGVKIDGKREIGESTYRRKTTMGGNPKPKYL